MNWLLNKRLKNQLNILNSNTKMTPEHYHELFEKMNYLFTAKLIIVGYIGLVRIDYRVIESFRCLHFLQAWKVRKVIFND